MSWAKRRVPTNQNPEQVPPQMEMYNPNQHSNISNQETHWQQQQNIQTHNSNWYDPTFQTKQDNIKNQAQTQQNYWQPSYNNQPQQQQQQQPYNQNTQYDHYQPEYYQDNSTTNQGYGNSQYNPQYTGQQNTMYQPQDQTEGDTWNSGWSENWEDNSNTLAVPQHQETQNNLVDSFATDQTWNWSVDNTAKTEDPPLNNELFSKVGSQAKASLKVEGDMDRLQPLDGLTGKRGKLETPQWSVESQMSQESSDDILQTSESDKSHMLSRSSTISHSPISGQDFGGAAQNLDDLQVKDETASNREVIQANPTPPPPPNLQTPPLPLPQGHDDSKGNPYKAASRMQHHKYRLNKPDVKQYGNQSVNLEAPPDNSEQPDSLPPVRKISSTSNDQPWAENNEAPINDRNQYLETGQLSNADVYSQSDGLVQENDALPPPGLRRLVLGQMEQSEGSGNEPPPGFSRMVPGQLESCPIAVKPLSNSRQSVEPPEVLHRMIPGESSSPEASLRQQSYQLDHHITRRQEDDSEPEFNSIGVHSVQPRSATIGADTPPALSNSTNRSETIGADTSPDPSKTSHQGNSRNRGTSGSSGDNRRSNSRENVSDRKIKQGIRSVKPNRRDSVEGQFQDSDDGRLTTSFRNLTVDNPSDENNPTESTINSKRHSKHGSSDGSEHGHRNKSPQGDHRGRRYHDKGGSDRDRGDRVRHKPPTDSRDKKYDSRRRHHKDRKYEDDTDYYSDRERDNRKPRDDKDYDRRYNSLRKEKEKISSSRKRRDHDGRETRRGGEYYYERYEDFDKESNTRASSRSDSLRDSYRERDRAHHDRDHRDRRYREKERYRRHNDSFNPYSQGYGYDEYSRYLQYQYWENLRKTDPQAYAKMYRKYYPDASGEAQPYYGMEDSRASVHSGRSSANDELVKDRYIRQSYYSQSSLPQIGGYYRGSQTHSISGQYGLDDSSFSRVMDQTDSLNFEESNVNTQRLTPAKFSTAHIKASISSGKLIKVLPHHPLDGQTPTVEMSNLESLLCHDEDYIELKLFPGPLVKGVSHKKTIIEYCESKIKHASYNSDITDTESYVLMWELLILLIRQNGMVVGTDIAELLLKNRTVELPQRSASAVSSINNNGTEGSSESGQAETATASNGNITTSLKEEDVTSKFREYLLYGSVQEALEWAMKNSLWGHALFLASKLDKRTYANVMMRFANGLTMNDPLQTLYQLLSARIPAAVTCVSDEKWGDWRPHLAMILSNTTQRPEINCKAITVMGDTLLNRGSLYAAQFCYLMAQVGFSRHGSADARLVLLGSNHNKQFSHFVTNEAIHMTEIYEYACSLNDPNFILPEFQFYKYLLSVCLADVGLLEKSLAYLERISICIVKNPSVIQGSLVNKVISLADRLKYYDPIGDLADDAEVDLDISRPDNSWLKDLRSVQNECDMGLISNQTDGDPVDYSNVEHSDQQLYNQEQAWPQQQPYQQQWNAEQDIKQIQQVEYQQQADLQQQQQQQQPQLQKQQQQQQDYSSLQYQEQQQQQQYWPNQQQWNDDKVYNQEPVEQQQPNYYGSVAPNEPVEVEKETLPKEIPQQPQISMPNHQKGKSPYDDEPLANERQQAVRKEAPSAKPKSDAASQEKSNSNGWFGGIFSKLTLKPKNQMKLPDDKNPSIVWDPEKKRWINTDEDNGEGSVEFKPPPKLSDMMPKTHSQQPLPQLGAIPQNFNTLPSYTDTQPDPGLQPRPSEDVDNFARPTQPNMFKLQRSRNLKKSYIDVFNPNGKSAPSAAQPALSLPTSTSMENIQTPQMNFFIPQPVHHDQNASTDFLTPAPPMQYDEQMSRWSSASSLSREVQSYTQRKAARLRR